MVSVCMAVFNGGQLLERQLFSILEQLRDDGELVIVDDASEDNTIAIVASMQDPRIRLLQNVKNLGPLKSFEKALQEAKGDYIFFADQDDCWLPNKVQSVIDCFNNSMALAIVTDAKVANHKDEIIHESYFEWRNSGPGFLKNFYKSTFLGCCMAIRKECKDFLLPFPPFAYMHDRWIGLACTAVGKVYFLPRKLLIYRRHENTVTQMKPSGVWQILKLRFFLGLSLLIASSRLLRWRRLFSSL
jgi:glycosyltransferase involved in cell wall biosynthesis